MTYALIPAALLAALFIWLFLRRRPHALFVLAYEKTGTPAPSSRLKNQWITAAEFEKRSSGFWRGVLPPSPRKPWRRAKKCRKSPYCWRLWAGIGLL